MRSKAIILGIAPCLEKDLQQIYFCNPEEFDLIAVGVDCSDRVSLDIQHAVTYHPEEFNLFYERRKLIDGNLDYKTHSHKNGVDPKTKNIIVVDYIWPLIAKSPYSGSSAFLASQAAVGLGYEKVVLCGCPMSGPNLNKPKTSSYSVFQKGWILFAESVLGDKVRSMSGWTRDFLGYPKEDWLNER